MGKLLVYADQIRDRNYQFLPNLKEDQNVTLLTVEYLTAPLWYKQQVTFLNPKSD